METTRIAVVRNSEGAIADLEKPNTVDIFTSYDGAWSLQGQLTLNLSPANDLAERRAGIGVLANQLAGVRLLAARSISGVDFNILSRSGLSLCAMDGFEPACLDGLAAAIAEEEENPPVVAPAPVDREGTGVYEFDLAAALAAYPDSSSKKLLKRFLDEATFLELRLTCGHLPPWLPSYLEERGLGLETATQIDGQALARIYHVCRG